MACRKSGLVDWAILSGIAVVNALSEESSGLKD
jgi:hypothetical protein